jgi:cobaltochelatase CobS
MAWRDKAFTLAIRRPGTVILLDEIMIAPPGTVAFFQTILDNRELHLPTGEVVPFAEGVCVIAADNTAGYGDESQVYAGTQSANAALVDRFSRLVVIDYLPPALEALALAKRTGAPAAACKRLALFAEAVRAAAAAAGGESRSYSYRRMTAFMGAVYRDKMSIERAWQVTMLTRLPEADRETFRVAVSAHFKEDLFKKELSGWTDAADAGDAPISTAPLSQSAEQVAARRLPDFQT